MRIDNIGFPKHVFRKKKKKNGKGTFIQGGAEETHVFHIRITLLIFFF
jgi:hypothetical protein